MVEAEVKEATVENKIPKDAQSRTGSKLHFAVQILHDREDQLYTLSRS